MARSERLPFDRLARYVGVVSTELVRRGPTPWLAREPRSDAEPLCAARAVSVALGDTVAQRRKCERWKHSGLTLEQAEDVAERLGALPSEIWPRDYYRLVGQLELAAEDWSYPEPEPGDTFCGRPSWWRATGRRDYYGDPDPFCEQLRLWDQAGTSSPDSAA